MLRVAKNKPGAEQVEWRLGFSDRADDESADFAVMSGHVAQVFREDEAWSRALQDLRRMARWRLSLATRRRARVATPAPRPRVARAQARATTVVRRWTA